MQTTTAFEVSRPHINVRVEINTGHGLPWKLKGILDTGAARTEISDKFLRHVGLIEQIPTPDVALPPGQETQKLGKLVLPELRVCGHTFKEFEVCVVHFEESWNIAALIGLDFFRRFPVTIDYERGVVVAGVA